MKHSNNDANGMKGNRSRNQDGQLRDKRDDTHMGTIEKQYNRDFGVRSDKELGNFLKENGLVWSAINNAYKMAIKDVVFRQIRMYNSGK